MIEADPRAALEGVQSLTDLAEKLQPRVSRPALAAHLRRWGWGTTVSDLCAHFGVGPEVVLTDAVQAVEFRAAAEVERWQRKAKFYERQYKLAVGLLADADNLVDRMRDVLAVVEPRPMCVPDWQPVDQEEEEAIMLFSDAQIGTKSLGQEIGLMQPRVYGPLGTYNFQVFRYRLRIWVKAVLKFLALHRAAIPVLTGHLWFLGDILENEWIWKGQGSYIETGLLQQFYAALYEVGQAIAVIAPHFETLKVRGVAGNHGRGTPKRNTSKTWVNWEWLWLRYLELICRDLPNVEFNLSMSWFDLPEVQGQTFLLLHGEDMRRYLKFPWYSADWEEKAYGALLESVGTPFKYLLFGHHHVAANFQTSRGWWMCNGNWVGPTMFGVKVLNEMALPYQWMLFSHAKRGLPYRSPIDLMVEDEELWQEIEETAYDIHVPRTNQAILTAVKAARLRPPQGV